jgi:hypothetical protein
MTSKTSSSGIGITGVLFVVFLVLKLTGNIDWSWWWVTSPLWILTLLYVGLFLITFILVSIFLIIGGSEAKIIVDNWKEKIKKSN